jgi:hypothetical protein
LISSGTVSLNNLVVNKSNSPTNVLSIRVDSLAITNTLTLTQGIFEIENSSLRKIRINNVRTH